MWTEEQNLAIKKRDSNILVSASAGSGKTAVLVERVINLVINYKVDIDKILVVTFTNASAVELKERLLLAIYEALNKNPNDNFLKRQLTYINRANITTIHAYCLEIIRSNFHLLDIDPNFSIVDEAEGEYLKLKAINKVLEKRYINSLEDKKEEQKLYNLLELFLSKEEDLIEHILKIHKYIMSFSYPFDYLKTSIEKYNLDENIDLVDVDFGKEIFDSVINELKILIKRTEDILNEIYENDEFKKMYDLLEKENEYLKKCINASLWDKLYESLKNVEFARQPTVKTSNEKLKEKVVTYRKEILKKQVETLKKSVYANSNTVLKDNKKAYKYLSYIYDILVEFDEEYNALKKKENLLDFNDIEHLALELLITKKEDGTYEKSEVAKTLEEKFVEVYTDEYQDTSAIQEEILSALSNGKNRFMVGDIKQSIYKFRQAMPEIFSKKYETYEKINDLENNTLNSKIILAKNFRSRKEVLESINFIFKKLMSKKAGDIDYIKDEYLTFGAEKLKESPNNNYLTELNIIDLKQEENIENEEVKENEETNENANDDVSKYLDELKDFEIEAIYIVKKIKDLVGKFDIYDKDTKTFRKAEYKDIVILLRNLKDKGNILEETFKKCGISSFCDKSSSVFDSDEIKLLLSLLRVIDNPYQDIYMVSVMYSIIGGFNLDDIVYIRSLNKNIRVYDNLKLADQVLSKKDNLLDFEQVTLTKIKKFLNYINLLNNYSKIYDVATLISKIYETTNIYTQYNLDSNSRNKKENLKLLVDIALNIAKKGILTINEYIKYVDNLKDKADSSTSSAKIIGENENVVRIMTIHKSKGLEFPIVILADTMRKYNFKDLSEKIIMHNNLGIGINIVDNTYHVTYPSLIKQAIKNLSENETKSEELRMLYVALTRAKEKLVIFATVKDYEAFKKKQFVIYENNKIDPQIVLKNSRYFENISMCLKNESKENIDKVFDLHVIKVDKEKKELLKYTNDTLENYLNIHEKIEKLNSNIVDNNSIFNSNINNILEKNIDYVYKDIELVNTLSRVSVSKLKQEQEYIDIKKFDEQDIAKKELEIKDKYLIPESLSENVRYTPLRKGTLIHFILEHLDINKEFTLDSLKSYITELCNKKVLIKTDVESINVNKIYSFLNSNLGKDIKKAKKIYREQEFILANSSFSSSIIQGVIDLYYINEKGNIILVDFKTDRLEDENLYITRYKKQLNIYKEALEKLTSRSVEHSYIYSFELNKEIEVL